ncbi:MAG: hypothetical protein ABMA26_05190 [Limisphaerales bacterium]
MGNLYSRQAGQGFYVQWRGRVEGPLVLEEIERRLENGQLGMLSQIKVDDTWISIRQFFQECEATRQVVQDEAAPSSSPNLPLTPASSNEEVFSTVESLSTPPVHRTLVVLRIALLCMVVLTGGIFAKYRFFAKAQIEVAQVNSTNPTILSSGALTTNPPTSGSNQIAQLSTGTNNVTPGSISSQALVTNAPASGSNLVAQLAPVTNLPNVTAINASKSVLSPLPANVSRTYKLTDMTELVGIILHVDDKGIIIKLNTGKLSARTPWNNFDIEALAREPKVIEYQHTKEKAQKLHEEARVAALAAAERAKAAAEERARVLAETREKQDKLLDQTIQSKNWKRVSDGYLKGWGNEVNIGKIFQVVSSNSARWTAAKLAPNEQERYTHYLVESAWSNDSGQRVEVQFLVDADGSSFRLHGCFLSGKKVPDGPFMTSVKDIWDKKTK